MKAIATEFRDRRQREERKHRLNREITAPEVRLSGPENEPIGVVSLMEALRMAGDLDVDLVEIAATANPPVCRLMDYGKFKYQEQKRAAEAKAKQTVIEIKEVKFRPGTDDGDYNIKLRNIRRFLAEGDKCKITLRFRGREITHQDIGMRMLQPRELAKAQGFPDDYVLNGSKSNQVAKIGNSVVPQVAKALVRANW